MFWGAYTTELKGPCCMLRREPAAEKKIAKKHLEDRTTPLNSSWLIISNRDTNCPCSDPQPVPCSCTKNILLFDGQVHMTTELRHLGFLQGCRMRARIGNDIIILYASIAGFMNLRHDSLSCTQ